MLEMGLKRSMKRADIIITDSEFSKSEIVKYFPQHEKKIRVVPCGVDLERFHPCTEPERIPEVKKSLDIKGDYFLYLGTIEPRKNLERLITAYGHLADKLGEDCPKLVMAGGKGWLNDGIYSRVERLGLTDKVIFTKYVPSDDLNPLMCGALAFVFPSIYEGFGMPPLEAMALRSSRADVGGGFTSRGNGRLCGDMRRLLGEKHSKGTLQAVHRRKAAP